MNKHRLFVALFIFALMYGCGSNSGGGTQPGTENPDKSVSSNEVFYFDHGVYAVDPTAPASPTMVSGIAELAGPDTVYQGSYDPETQTVSDLRPYSLIWIGSRKIYRMDVAAGSPYETKEIGDEPSMYLPNPDPLRTSQVFCGEEIITDWANPDASWYKYTLSQPGSFSSVHCTYMGSDEVKVVPINSTLAPFTPPGRIIQVIRDPATGGIVGWLLMINNDLVRTDASFANSAVVEASANTVYAAMDQNGNLILQVNGELRRYDVVSGTLSTVPLFSGIPIIRPLYIQDADNLYFDIETDFTTSIPIYRLPLNATTTNAAVQLVNAEGGQFRGFRLTTNKLIYTVKVNVPGSSDPVSNIKSISKTAASIGIGTTLLSQTSTGSNPRIAAVTDNLIYLDEEATPGQYTAVVIDEDGNPVADFGTGSCWMRNVYKNTLRIYEKMAIQGLLDKVLLASGCTQSTNLSSIKSYANAKFIAVDANSPSNTVELGTLGADVEYLDLPLTFRPEFMFYAHLNNSGELRNYFADANTAGSLQQIK